LRSLDGFVENHYRRLLPTFYCVGAPEQHSFIHVAVIKDKTIGSDSISQLTTATVKS